jgi:hypothetical protein
VKIADRSGWRGRFEDVRCKMCLVSCVFALWLVTRDEVEGEKVQSGAEEGDL